MKNKSVMTKKIINTVGYAIERKWPDYFLAIVCFLSYFILDWGFVKTVFFAFFVWTVLNPLKIERYFQFSIIGLLIAPILILLKMFKYAEGIAILVFLFFCIGLILQMFEKK